MGNPKVLYFVEFEDEVCELMVTWAAEEEEEKETSRFVWRSES